MSFKWLNSIHFKHHLQYSPYHFLSEAMSSWTASQHICSCPRIQFQTSLTLLLLLPSLALLKSILSHTLHKLNWTSIFPHKSLQWASPTLVWVCSFTAAFHQPLQQSIPSATLHQHNAGLSEAKKNAFVLLLFLLCSYSLMLTDVTWSVMLMINFYDKATGGFGCLSSSFATHTSTTFCPMKNRNKFVTDRGSQSQMFGKEGLSYDRHGLGM